MSVAHAILITTTKEMRNQMDKQSAIAIYIYVTAICVPSLLLAFIAPPAFSQAALAMIASSGMMVVAMVALIRHYEK
jgi:hypothetical protein